MVVFRPGIVSHFVLCMWLCASRLLEHGAKDSAELQMLVAPMSDEELMQVHSAMLTRGGGVSEHDI